MQPDNPSPQRPQSSHPPKDYLTPITVLVCGGRTYRNGPRVMKTLDNLEKQFRNKGSTIATIIEGGASGADALGRIWALNNKKECKTFRAEWSKYGKQAGFIRNQTMLTKGRPHYAVVFPGGNGTAHMHSLIVENNVPHTVVSIKCPLCGKAYPDSGQCACTR